MFNLNSLSKQIGFGYALILSIFIISLILTLKQLNNIEASSDKIKDLRSPTARSSLMLLNGINHSLAALRGWMLIGYEEGGEKFIRERKKAWNEEITKSIDEMDLLSAHWTNAENIKHLRSIKSSLKDFESYQNQIEIIANSDRNREASEILFTEAAPKAAILMAEVTTMIELEKTRDSSITRKNILAILADLRGSFGLCLANIRAFILSGDDKFRVKFEQQWKINSYNFSQLSLNRDHLNKKQLLAYENFSRVRADFSSFPKKMFEIRGSENWDQAKFLLKNKAAPLAFEIKKTLRKMVEYQDELQTQEYIKTHNQFKELKWLLIFLLLIGSISSIFVGLKFIRRIKVPLDDIIDIIKGMSKGQLNLNFKESHVEEIRLLSESVQLMKDNLLERNIALEGDKNRLEEEDWIKTSLTSILENLPGHTELKNFSHDLLNNLVPKVNGLVAVLYIKHDSGNGNGNGIPTSNNSNTKLTLIGSYACSIDDKSVSHKINLGEGLAGQCALTQQTMYISDIPDNYLSINSPLRKITAKHIALLPISFEEEILGVIEIGSIEQFSNAHKNLLDQVIKNTGIILKAVLGRIETEKLLQFLNTQNQALNEHTNSLVEAKKLAEFANKDLAAQKTAMDQHSLVSVTDIKGIITYANDRFCAVSGYSREELIGKNHRLLNSNKQPKNYWRDMFLTVSKGEFWHDEVCNRAKDGHLYWVDTTIVPLYDGENTLTGYTSIRTDISSQKEIITRLDEAKKQADVANKDLAAQKTAMDQHSLVSVTDIKGIITYANDRFCAVSGYSREELIGQNHRLLNSDNQPKNYWRDMFLAVSKGEFWHDEVCNKAKDGHLYWVDTTIVPLYDSENKLTGYTSIRTDISSQKEIITRLDEAKKQADVANESKTDFLANMSHEIRTPMNGVIGMTNLLLDTELDQEQHNFAKTVKNSAESLLTIINDILDFSKVEAGMLDLEPLEFDLEQLLHELGSNIAFRAHEKGLELICPANVMKHQSFIADPGRIRQILTNLIGNAIKFTEQGEVAVYCKVQNRSEQQTELLFEVTDTGIGLSDEEQNKLFERFSQADGSTTRKYGGTGLGLSISKQLVELMQGEIGVKTSKDKGSTFWFTLKLANAANQQPHNMTDNLHNQKVLVVDDNATNRTLIGHILNNWQVEHTLVESGKLALKKLTEGISQGAPYHIAILDMQMPEMDGLQLGTDIKNDPSLSATHLVMLTSQGLRGDAEKLKLVGFGGYLSKPIDQSVLYNTLIKVAGVNSEDKQLLTAFSPRELPQFKARVLVVEDNAINQKVAQGLLKKFGIQADLAGNGEEALHALKSLPYDLVFMDCQMPVMDGYEASRQIRDLKSNVLNRAVPIVAMTANTMQGDREKCLSVGMSDFISKPVNPVKLQEALRQWLPKFSSDVTKLKAPMALENNN